MSSLPKRILRSVPLYVNLRRWQREGFSSAIARYYLWRKILQTKPVNTAEAGAESKVEVHLLCYQRDYLSAIWSLKSFYHQSRVDYPLAIHIQGPLSAKAKSHLRFHFPDARILTQEGTTAEVTRILRAEGLDRLLKWRNTNPFMMKLVDFRLFLIGQTMLALDSDVLFFRKPTELLTSIEETLKENTFTFQRDTESTYNINRESARINWSIDLPEEVNSGVVVCQTGAVNLKNCDSWLADEELARSTGWIEQTLYALSAAGRTRYLPKSYLISREKHLDSGGLTMRHYAGDTRPLLTDEGMPHLVSIGFLRDASSGTGFV